MSNTLRFSKRRLLVKALERSGCNRVLSSAPTWQGLLTLNYHRIGHPDDSPFDHGLWSSTHEEFARQVAYLAKNFDVVGIDDLDDVLKKRSGRHVMITFDDGYRDNYELAFPILRQHRTPATFFLTTGFLDQPKIAWWDEIAWMVHTSTRSGLDRNVWTIQPVDFTTPGSQDAINVLLSVRKSLKQMEADDYLDFLADATGSGRCPGHLAEQMWMTWDMVREMQIAGMGFGGHTVNHPVLTSCPPDDQDREIAECLARIESELREAITAFSYPVGSPAAFDEISRVCLQSRGCRWAFSYYGQYVSSGRFDRYDLPRVAIESDMSFGEFRSIVGLPQLFA